MPTKFQGQYLKSFISQKEYDGLKELVKIAHNSLHHGFGLGSDFLGWLTLPADYDLKEFIRIKKTAKKIQRECDILIVIGIGGSYLGARAVIEFVSSPNYNKINKDTPDIYFSGNNMSTRALKEILQICNDKEIAINVVSKSGSTIEPSIAFRVIKEFMEEKYGKEKTRSRIFCTTDKKTGALQKLAQQEGYETFSIPTNIGGRYSVLTSAGMLPMAVCGLNIDNIMAGAKEAMIDFDNPDLNFNDCYKYAASRNILYNKGKNVEVLVSYEPSFAMMHEWLKQLYAESEGKDQKGILPTSVIFTTDLHSMGQYIQDGRRFLFETVILIKNDFNELYIKKESSDIDGLNFLNGKTMSFINRKAFEGTALAHVEGGVPNIVLEMDSISEKEVGYLIYFFQKACAISGYLLGVNPFDQPGVEKYKKNMFRLIGKNN